MLASLIQSARVVVLGASLVAVHAAHAAVAVHSILLDTDANPATGCPVTTVKGVVSGVEQILDTTVTTTPTGATVTTVERRMCSGGTLGATQPVAAGGWPVGLGNGAGGKAVIETGLPLSSLGAVGAVRLAVMASSASGADAILVNAAGGALLLAAPAAPGSAQPIPALHPAVLGLLAVVAAGLGAAFARRRGLVTVAAVAIALVLAAGVVAAGLVIKDGQVGDWAGVGPLGTDAAGNAPPNVDLLAIHAQYGPGELLFRIDADVVLESAPPPGNTAPVVNAGADQGVTLPAIATLAGSATDDGLPAPPGVLTYTWSVTSGPAAVTFGTPAAAGTTASFTATGTYVLRLAASDSALSGFDEVQVTVSGSAGGALPPEPATVATSVDRTTIVPFLSGIEFLFKGSPPIQTGVAQGAIEAMRAAVIRGQVLDRSGAPLPGARVSILHHPEFGQTLSRADGRYDLAVNGGGKLIVRVEKAGFFEVQRDVIVPWQDFVHAADVVLTPPDSAASPVALGSATPQVARANAVTDGSGTRRATLLVLPGTTAQFRMPDGSLQPAPANLTVRQTEYTVGALGPASMPSELPSTSGYTYYLELTADEELAAGAVGVEFSQPVVFYVENFLGFPVGGNAPVGFYDRQAGAWKGEPDGRVVRVVANAGGVVDLDTDGNGTPDNGVGTGQGGANLAITVQERQALAPLYAVGQSLWRVEAPHFSPGDINWPFGPPPDAVPPNAPPPVNEDPRKVPCNCAPCKAGGSIIECGNQTLGESIAIVGTGMSLNYRSDRVPGRREAYRLDVPITGTSVPASLASTRVEVSIAGQQYSQGFGNAPAQGTSYRWDGKDGYGRTVQGMQRARVRVGFEYPAVYQATPADYYRSWGLASGNPTGITGRNLAQIFRDTDVWLGAWDARGLGLGGWSLSAHHVYDHRNRTLYLGSGERRRDIDGLAPVVVTIAGNGTAGAPIEGPALASPMFPQASPIVVEPDGAVLFISTNFGPRLLRVRPDGTLQRVAGGAPAGAPLFGVPARDANFGFADRIARGPDGSIYVTYRGPAVIARIRPSDQVVERFAGTLDQTGFAGDGGAATSALLNFPRDIAVGTDGSVFVHDAGNNRIRRIGPDGIINTIAGNGASCGGLLPDPLCDEGPALGQKVGAASSYNHLAIAPDGSLYATRVAGTFAPLTEIYRIGNDGMLKVIGGKRDRIPNGVYSTNEGVLALDANYVPLSSLTVDKDGTLFYGYTFSFAQKTEIRYIDHEGRVRILAGSQTGFDGDGGPARSARFGALPPGIGFGPDGALVIADQNNNRLRKLQSRFPGFAGAADILLPAADGSVVYRFDANGRHLQTHHALTGAALYTFAYDTAGLLASVTDGDGNVTTIQRAASGAPTAIVAPFGQVTQLATDADGWLTRVTNPASESVALVHQADGLLTGMITPKGQAYAFAYDPATGFLVSDVDPAGGQQTLARTPLPPDATRSFGHEIAKTTGLGRTTSYRVESLRTGERVETATAADGTRVVMSRVPVGSVTTASADGTLSTGIEAADPRWGMLAPLTASSSIRVPSGKTLTATQAASATLADPADVFSLQQLDATVTLNGRSSSTRYTAATRELRETSAAGRVASATFDTMGRPTSEQFGGLAATIRTYDTRGRVISMTTGSGADARSVSFAYDASGYLQSIIDPIGRLSAFTYDAAGRITGQTLPDGRAIALGYDANGNVTSIAPPGRPAHGATYSAVDLESGYDPPDVAGVAPDATNVTYNADRQPTQVARADGRAITAAYDVAGRLASTSFTRGSIAASYDGTNGRITALSAPNGVAHAFGYDGPLLLAHTLTGPVPGVVSWTYDTDFRTATQSVNGANTVTFGYDADSLLTQAGALAISRHPQSGLPVGSTLGAVADAWTYNSHGEPVDYQVSVSGSPVYRSQFTRDALGRIVQKVETINGVTATIGYAYDVPGRLATVNRNALPTGYSYDANSNRIGTTGPSGTVAGAIYDAQDRLLQYGSTTYGYDNHGGLTTRTQGAATTQYTYDELGNLIRVLLADGTPIEYVVDALNRRIGKKVNGALVKRWLYDGRLRIVAEFDGAGALQSRFVYASRYNVPEYVVRGASTYRLVTDYLGSPRLLIDVATGAIAGTMDHDAYGRVTQDSLSTLIPFGYAGGLYDSQTGLTRHGARDYDAETGRWTVKDPIGFNSGMNLYAYVHADPVNFLDPRGYDGVPARWASDPALRASYIETRRRFADDYARERVYPWDTDNEKWLRLLEEGRDQFDRLNDSPSCPAPAIDPRRAERERWRELDRTFDAKTRLRLQADAINPEMNEVGNVSNVDSESPNAKRFRANRLLQERAGFR